MLKALVLTIENEEGQGLTKEEVKKIYDLIFPEETDQESYDKWFESAKRYTKMKEEWQIVIVLDDKYDGEIITYATVMHPTFTSTAEYLP